MGFADEEAIAQIVGRVYERSESMERTCVVVVTRLNGGEKNSIYHCSVIEIQLSNLTERNLREERTE